jgi:glycerophosphoryl diester phosphodiesterase
VILPERLYNPHFAHRGLWNHEEAPENSLRAFAAACDAGYGLEFDVRLAADDEVVVFHDDSLKRMTGRDDLVCDLTTAELQDVSLAGSDQAVPTLRHALEMIDGRQMALIELKSISNPTRLEPRVAEVVEAYEGPRAIISFNAPSLGWFADFKPDELRGLDVTGLSDAVLAQNGEELERHLYAAIAMARPHFLALALDMIGGRISRRFRESGYPVVAWTVRSAADANRIAEHCDNLIFEGFTA